MKITLTADVPKSVSDELIAQWKPLAGDIEVEHIRQLQVLPPAFIQFIADALTWTTLLKVGASRAGWLFLREFIKGAGKKMGEEFGGGVPAALKQLGAAIIRAREESPRHPTISFALPIPDDFESTRITFEPKTETEATWMLACFVAEVSAIEAFIRNEMDAGRLQEGPVQLTLQPDGSFRAMWMDVDSGKKFDHAIPQVPNK